jgi:hypothetical protein
VKSIFIFIFLILIKGGVAHASEVYFTFNSESYFVHNIKEFEIALQYDLANGSEEMFYVKPHIQNGTIEIYNSKTEKWVKSTDFTNELPTLKSSMFLRIQYGSVNKTDVWLELIDCINDKTYITPKREYWTPNSLSKYLEVVAERLESIKESSESTVPMLAEKPPGSGSFELWDISGKYKKIYYGISLIALGVCFAFGYISKVRKC